MDDVLIVGAGPAGLAVALQLQRYGLVPRLFERSRPGGLLWNANRVENYPGFQGGISGPDLVRAILEQSKEVMITEEAVIELCYEDGLFYAKTLARTYPAKVAVIASGTKPLLFSDLTIPHELQKRVLYEVIDILEVTNKKIVVVGNGDAAFDYAANMARANQVIILNRSNQVKCLPCLWKQAQECHNLIYYPNTAILRLVACTEGGMRVECSGPNGILGFQADYLVGAIGREPQLDFISESLNVQATELEKRGILHFVGDVKNGIFRQVAIAIGDGILAGMRIFHTLKENAHEGGGLNR
ncbi:MAG: NAD(P)/FAD-dependent oxidoreductase [Anaerolineales bacterium]|nr:NAD(P)/FAD-dependent oxidoreductase [Anaerolineales bacterium]